MQYEHLGARSNTDKWYCKGCRTSGQMDPNRLTWELYGDENEVKDVISKTYSEIVTWDKNLMLVPRGKAGKDFINEISRLLSLFTLKSPWEPVALSLVQIFIPLMLQKPSQRSKAKENSKYLASRLLNWQQGNLGAILSECREIQKKVRKLNSSKDFNLSFSFSNSLFLNLRKIFCQRMLEGKIGQATRLIDNENRTGLLPVDPVALFEEFGNHIPSQKLQETQNL